MELGVQRVGAGAGKLVDELVELCLVGDPVEVGHGATLAHREPPAPSSAIGAAWVRRIDPLLAELEPAFHFGVHRTRGLASLFMRDDLGLRLFARGCEGERTHPGVSSLCRCHGYIGCESRHPFGMSSGAQKKRK